MPSKTLANENFFYANCLIVDVKSFPSDVEEEELARISLKKFVNDISHCPDCKNNPAFFLSSKKVPVCMKHWNLIAEEPVAWTEEGKVTLLVEVKTRAQ